MIMKSIKINYLNFYLVLLLGSEGEENPCIVCNLRDRRRAMVECLWFRPESKRGEEEKIMLCYFRRNYIYIYICC